MELILARSDGTEERVLNHDISMDVGFTNDFELTMPYEEWDGEVTFGKMIYIPGTEYGGIIGEIEGNTELDVIYVRGYVWRGYIQKRIIVPPDGQSHKVVSGELNDIIREIIGDVFYVPEISSGGYASWQFERYTDALTGLSEMLASVGYRLRIVYNQLNKRIEVDAVPTIIYGSVEISQDGAITFTSTDNRRGVNHLLCLGTGQNEERIVINLYADGAGNISETQTFYGIDEITEVYEYSSADRAALLEGALKRFREVMNTTSFSAKMSESDIGVELSIGDSITGRDYITGTVVTKPITDKTVKVADDNITVTYKIEGQT